MKLMKILREENALAHIWDEDFAVIKAMMKHYNINEETAWTRLDALKNPTTNSDRKKYNKYKRLVKNKKYKDAATLIFTS